MINLFKESWMQPHARRVKVKLVDTMAHCTPGGEALKFGNCNIFSERIRLATPRMM